MTSRDIALPERQRWSMQQASSAATLPCKHSSKQRTGALIAELRWRELYMSYPPTQACPMVTECQRADADDKRTVEVISAGHWTPAMPADYATARASARRQPRLVASLDGEHDCQERTPTCRTGRVCLGAVQQRRQTRLSRIRKAVMLPRSLLVMAPDQSSPGQAENRIASVVGTQPVARRGVEEVRQMPLPAQAVEAGDELAAKHLR